MLFRSRGGAAIDCMEDEREMACGRAGWRIEVRVLLRLGDLEWMDAPADWGRRGDGATEPVVAV